ncbi:MAG: DNA alkylation repair protein [Thermoplasmatota archaeon]
MDERVGWLVEQLAAVGTADRAVHEKKYLKSDLEHLGASVPATRNIAKQAARQWPDAVANPWPLVQACWAEGIYELRSGMAFFLEHADVGPDAVDAVEALLRDAHTWAIIDQLAIRIVPRLEPDDALLRRWLADDDFWVRRTAILAPLLAFRLDPDDAALQQWAKRVAPHLNETEFFIRKAIGWMLREIGKTRPDWTAEFVLRHEMSGLTRREATRNLPEALRP